MSNPIWTQETKYIPEDPRNKPLQVDCRIYNYHFESEWFHWITRYRHEVRLRFFTEEIHTNGDSGGHRRVLENPDFTINDMNVVEWIKESITTGKADFTFYVSRLHANRWTSQLELVAKFSDKRQAMMFKLAFG